MAHVHVRHPAGAVKSTASKMALLPFFRTTRVLVRPSPINKKAPPEKQAGLFCLYGGEGGIRTLDTNKRIHTFQACSFGHSDTSPNYLYFLYMSSDDVHGCTSVVLGMDADNDHFSRNNNLLI